MEEVHPFYSEDSGWMSSILYIPDQGTELEKRQRVVRDVQSHHQGIQGNKLRCKEMDIATVLD